MMAIAISAFCPIHNTCSNGSTTVRDVREFIDSSDITSIETVLRYGYRILDKGEHHAYWTFTEHLLCIPVHEGG